MFYPTWFSVAAISKNCDSVSNQIIRDMMERIFKKKIKGRTTISFGGQLVILETFSLIIFGALASKTALVKQSQMVKFHQAKLQY